MRNFGLTTMALVLAIGFARTVAHGEDAPASQPSTAPAAGAAIEATDTDALKAAAGKTITVHGTVSGTFKPKSGVLLVNFEHVKRAFTLMIPRDNVEGVAGGFGGDIEKGLKGKTILATGEIKLYHDRPEMEIIKPDQIKVEEEKQ